MEKRSEKIGKVDIDLTWYGGEDLYSEGPVEEELLKIVKEEPSERFNEIIAGNGTWNVMYHLSDKRGNIADFIPIQKKHRVLEIGAGCGAITGTLAKKAFKVTAIELSYRRSQINAWRNKDFDNIEIIVGNLEDIEPHLEEKYDYIFLVGVLEYAGSYISGGGKDPCTAMLKMLIPHLAQGGEIAVAIENKFGLKYLGGSREDHTGKFYDGIEGYLGISNVKTFSRSGLISLAKKAGLRTEFYYPYPDYKLPETIFSDERLPVPGDIHGKPRNFDNSRFISFDEAKVFDEVIREEGFPEVSNSFLVLMSTEDRIESFDVRRILYSKHSDERDPKYQIRTDLLTDGYHKKFIVKYPKTQAAEAHLLKMYDTSVKLAASLRNSPVRVNRVRLLTDADGGFSGLQFEFLEGRSLDDILAGLFRDGRRDAALKIIRQYAVFVRAKKLPDLDLIFSNIMITPDGAWNITDYEWVQEGADPDFVIYRALRYLINDHPGLCETALLYQAAGLDAEKEAEFGVKEMELQHSIAGDYISLDKMYSIFGKGGVTLSRAMESMKWLMRPAHARIYADRGEGFAEGDMPVMDGNITDDMTVSCDIPLPVGVKKLRIDPQECRCIVRLLKSTVREASVNGRVCGSTIIFDTADPQIIFDLPEGLSSFHIEYTIQMTDDGVYDDILAKLTEYETAPKGIKGIIKRTPEEKREYDRVSALSEAD